MTPRPFYIAVIGVGGVGKEFVSQLATLSQRYTSQGPSAPINIHLSYVCRSTKALLAPFTSPSISFSTWESDLAASSTKPLDTTALISHLTQIPSPGKAVLIDNTSSQSIASSYPSFLRAGISVVTPNKKAFSSSLSLWDNIFTSAANGTSTDPSAGYIFHESSVGAGLPTLSTLTSLIATGDSITHIQGIFSGTLSFLFNAFNPLSGSGGSFSAEVATAQRLGYTEPDPRDDLNGLDVARKLTILARLSGLRVAGPEAFAVESLIPTELESVASAAEFMDKLGEYDARMERRRAEAQEQGMVLRYVGSVDVQQGVLEVGLQTFEASHPIAALKGSDNIFSYSTKRLDTPMIIQGAGAGAGVTAFGITSDLLKVFACAR